MSVLRATEVLWKSRKDGLSDRRSGLPLVLFERMGLGWGSTQNIVHTPPGGICIIFLEMVMSWILKDVQKLARCQLSIQVFQKEGTRARAMSRPGRWRGVQWASQCGSDWGVEGNTRAKTGGRLSHVTKDPVDRGMAKELTFIGHLQYCFPNKETETQRTRLACPTCTGLNLKSVWLQSLCSFFLHCADDEPGHNAIG